MAGPAGGESNVPIEIDCQSVKRMLDAGEDFLLLDCREQAEFDTVAIAGATLLPMSQMLARSGELEPHRDRRIVVYCHLGGRSLQVAAWLRQRDFAHVQNLTGGIDAWSREIDPSLPRY
jgi:rhodanese-related sulfurtransferase